MPERQPRSKIVPVIHPLQDSIDKIEEKVNSLDEAIRGNGRGLVTQVALLHHRLLTLEEFAGEIRSIKKWFMLGLAGLFGTLLWDVIEWYLTHKPSG